MSSSCISISYNLDQKEFVGKKAGYAHQAQPQQKKNTGGRTNIPTACCQGPEKRNRRQLTGLVLVVNTRRFVYSHLSGFVNGISQKAVEVVSLPLPEDTPRNFW